jgi:hypothetical protein
VATVDWVVVLAAAAWLVLVLAGLAGAGLDAARGAALGAEAERMPTTCCRDA